MKRLLGEIVRIIANFLECDIPICAFYSELTGIDFKARRFYGNCEDFYANGYKDLCELRVFVCTNEKNHNCKIDFDCSWLVAYSSKSEVNEHHRRPQDTTDYKLDLTPLRDNAKYGSKLLTLDLYVYSGTLECLRDAPLEDIMILCYTGSLEPLRGKPLKTINFHCYKGNFEALNVESITMFMCSNYPGDLEFLRDAPNLRFIRIIYFKGSLEPLFNCKKLKYVDPGADFTGEYGPLAQYSPHHNPSIDFYALL